MVPFNTFRRTFLSLSAYRKATMVNSSETMNNDFGEKTLEYLKTKMKKRDLRPPSLTMANVREILNERLGATRWLERHRRNALRRPVVSAAVPLPPRRLEDNFSSALIPLASDHNLQDRYVTFLDEVRTGRLMEDLDMFSVWVASDHLAPRSQPGGGRVVGKIVTLLADSIDLVDGDLTAENDLRVSGFVSWVGRSTIETELWLESLPGDRDDDDDSTVVGHARFLLALRDVDGAAAAPVNRLELENELECDLVMRADERRKRKRAQERSSPYAAGPNAEESRLLHRWMCACGTDADGSRPPTSGALRVQDARLSTTVFCHPENRNVYDSVFGGHLMRLAVELSWQCVWLHMRQKPRLVSVGDVRFHRPVEVSSLLQLRAHAVYAHDRSVVVRVVAFVHEPHTGETFRTNDFDFTYRLAEPARSIVPDTYETALMYLDGRRRVHDDDSTSPVFGMFRLLQ